MIDLFMFFFHLYVLWLFKRLLIKYGMKRELMAYKGKRKYWRLNIFSRKFIPEYAVRLLSNAIKVKKERERVRERK